MNEIVSRIVASVVVMMLAAIVMLAGLGFLFAALYLGLLRYLDPAAAALAVGMAAFLLALVFMLIARRSSRASPKAAVVGRLAAPSPLPASTRGGRSRRRRARHAGSPMKASVWSARMPRARPSPHYAPAWCSGSARALRRTIWRFMQ